MSSPGPRRQWGDITGKERESESFWKLRKISFQAASVHWQGRSPEPRYGFQSSAQEGVDTVPGQGDESLEWRHELDEKVSV